MRVAVSLVSLFILFNGGAIAQKINIETNYENGNGLLVYQNRSLNVIAVRPQLKNGDRLNIWFNFKVSGFRMDTLLTIIIPFERSYFAPDPIVIMNKDKWERIPAVNEGFYNVYRIQPLGDTMQVASGVPYTYDRLITYLEQSGLESFFLVSPLVMSELGRVVPVVRIGNDAIVEKKGSLLFTARQHAFEAPSSFFMEGLMRFFCSRGIEANYLRDHYDIFIVPMVDVDQVAAGGTGKDQLPVDFNRNWIQQPHWKAISAIMNLADSVNKALPLKFFLDIHSPFPVTNLSSHYYSNYSDGSEQYLRLQAFFNEFSQREGFNLPMVRNNRVTEEQRTIRSYMLDERCRETGAYRFNQLLIATTYEQSWQVKPDGTPYTTEQIFESAYNMGLSIYDFLVKTGDK